MKAIKIDTTKYTEEQILALAQSKGYQLKVMEEKTLTNEEGNETTQMEEVDNTQSAEDYLADRVKDLVTQFFAERLIREARDEARTAEREAQEQIKSDIEKTIEIIEV